MGGGTTLGVGALVVDDEGDEVGALVGDDDGDEVASQGRFNAIAALLPPWFLPVDAVPALSLLTKLA